MLLRSFVALGLFSILTLRAGWAQETFWYQTGQPGGPLSTQDVRSFAVNSQGYLFAGTWWNGEIYKTTDVGNSWTLCSPLPAANPVLGLTVDRHDHIFASVYLRGIARSTDNGATWQMKNNGLTNLATRLMLVDRQGNLWVVSEGGLFCSTNDGENWSNKRPGWFSYMLMDSTGAIVAAEYGSQGAVLHRSTDGGTTWSDVSFTGVELFAVHPDGSYWACSYDSKISRSTDYGATWTDMHSPVSWTGYTGWIMITPQGHIYYSRDGDAAGVLRSTDNGETWLVTNGGLSTRRVYLTFYHPGGYVFAGTVPAGVFRSKESIVPQEVTVSLPEAVTAAGTTLEIPVNVSNVSGWGIYAYEFTLTFNNPDSILSFDPTPITSGTLSGASSWSVLLNSTEPNRVTVGAYGATPLSGQGPLLKLKVHTSPAAAPGDSSGLTVSRFIFNTGAPQPSIGGGSIEVVERICGDADENGSVQAYDAALTLREALGPMTPPPPPLSTLGRVNADITMDGKVQSYDAALILRHVLGLPMPESTATCFGAGQLAGTPTNLALSARVLGTENGTSHTALVLQLADAPADMHVYSCSFELTCTAVYGDTASLTLPQLGPDFLATVNPLGNGHFRVGIVNPYGVDIKTVPLTLTARYTSSLNQVIFTEIFLNDVQNDAITLSNIFTSVEPPARSVKPQSYDLVGAYPNPFNPSTRIVFQTPTSGRVRLEVYNLQGTKIKTLRDEEVDAGQHEVFWDGMNNLGQKVATGEYFCVMKSDSFVKTVRLLLLK